MRRLKQFLIYSAIIIIPAVYLTWSVISKTSVHCEVCIEYKGASKCREASGTDENSCRQTATDNACAFLAGGMTESIACGGTPPTSFKVKN